MKNICLSLLIFFLSVVSVSAFTENSKSLELTTNAISADKSVSQTAILELRAMKQQGLDLLLSNFSAEKASFEKSGTKSEEWMRIADAVDKVSMQKDAYSSRLYWFTDLELAKTQAKLENKPILSLRLLGNLNEEFSCANSRFFRSILYSNSEISKYLRENYILHWKSVRPAPKVTIDFGDGRKIERTLTGNSIHYILDEQGNPIDALPGLYSPSVFLRYLTQAKGINNLIDAETKAGKGLSVLRYRKAKFDEIAAKRDSALRLTGVRLKESTESVAALDIAPLAMTKMVTEATILRDISDSFVKFSPNIAVNDWKKLAVGYSAETKIDNSSVAFICRQNPQMSAVEINKLITNTENYVSLDTAQNEFVFHTQIYSMLNSGRYPNLDDLNAAIYEKLFKTPDSDKWLGMYSADIYTALDGNGILK